MTPPVAGPDLSNTRLETGRNLRRRLRRWPVSSIVILSVLIVSAVFAPLIAPHDAKLGDLSDRHIPPMLFGGTSDHILGTDGLGRDILSRIVHGARISVAVAVVALSVGGVIGTLLGVVSGYAGGWVDEVIMRIVDIKFAVPLILIALALAVILGPSFGLLLGLLSFLIWGHFARQVRAEVLVIVTMDYVAAARSCGASPVRIMYRHIFPGVISIVVVVGTLQVGAVVLAEASLSFLGAGVPSPTPAWGSMVAEGRLYIDTAWWVSLIPGVVIGLLVTAVTLLGDWLRDRLDPRLRQIQL
ncbi:MAG TPA: ABC transporter permease [Dehalococcoidia bacterium]|mgnify:FL=1|jgi:peptide/nickel transport system permease protein|nr:peptide ABC transporter permease [Dehalococcoidia bacterium]HIN14434.1 ABC transporter permease [Dehalococcoidia bacterium]